MLKTVIFAGGPRISSISKASSERIVPSSTTTKIVGVSTGRMTRSSIASVPAPATRAISRSDESRLRNAGVNSITCTATVFFIKCTNTIPHH